MDQIVLQLGVGGALAFLIIKEVLGFLKTKNGNGKRAMQDKIDDLWDWHNHDDPVNPGSKVWYMTGMGKKITDLEKKMDDMHDDQHVIIKELRDKWKQ